MSKKITPALFYFTEDNLMGFFKTRKEAPFFVGDIEG